MHVQRFECKIVETTLLDECLSCQEQIAVLLDQVIVLGIPNIVANFFYVRPAFFNIQSVVKRKLLMNHSKRVIGPHMVVAIVTESRCATSQITVVHMTVRKD